MVWGLPGIHLGFLGWCGILGYLRIYREEPDPKMWDPWTGSEPLWQV